MQIISKRGIISSIGKIIIYNRERLWNVYIVTEVNPINCGCVCLTDKWFVITVIMLFMNVMNVMNVMNDM